MMDLPKVAALAVVVVVGLLLAGTDPAPGISFRPLHTSASRRAAAPEAHTPCETVSALTTAEARQ
jgi:hypothetical protein